MAETLRRNEIDPMVHMARNNDVRNYVNERGNYYLGIFSPDRNVSVAQEFLANELDVIGITESFNDFLVMLHLKTGWPLEDFLYVKEKVRRCINPIASDKEELLDLRMSNYSVFP